MKQFNNTVQSTALASYTSRYPFTETDSTFVEVGHYLAPFVLFLICYHTSDAFMKHFSLQKPEKFLQRFTPRKEDKCNQRSGILSGAALSESDRIPPKYTIFPNADVSRKLNYAFIITVHLWKSLLK